MSVFKRKIQDNKKAGSFFVILPHAWVDGQKLKQSDTLFFEEQSDGALLVRPIKEVTS